MGRLFELIRRRAVVTSIAAIVAVAAGASIATGAIPGGGGKISGCYEPRTGLLRVIDADAGRTCTRYEEAISWNQQGPPGPPGTVDTSNFFTKTESNARFLTQDAAAGTGDTTADESSDPISFFRIKDLTTSLGDGSITSAYLKNGTVGSQDLADDAVVGGAGGVVKDGSINGADLSTGLPGGKLAGGSVDKSKLVANATASFVGSPPLLFVPAGGTTLGEDAAQATVIVAGPDSTKAHSLMISGQMQLQGSVVGTDVMTAHWQVFRGSIPVTQEYSAQMFASSQMAFGSVAQIVPDATEGATETYTLHVSAQYNGAAPAALSVYNAVLNVVDLGRTTA